MPRIPFLNQRKPKPFSLGHRIYDERKDRLQRMMAGKGQEGVTDENKEAYLSNVRDKMERSRHNSKQNKGSTMRILVIFALLMLIAYIFLSQ